MSGFLRPSPSPVLDLVPDLSGNGLILCLLDGSLVVLSTLLEDILLGPVDALVQVVLLLLGLLSTSSEVVDLLSEATLLSEEVVDLQ